jgi:molecular chaperone GrpE
VSPGDDEREDGPVIRDRRRIDPETGEVRKAARPVDEPAQGPGKHRAEEAEETEAAAPGSAPGTEAGAADQVAALKAALADRTNDIKRVQAEYVNYKRRVERDREAVRELAVGGVLSELLPIVDDIGRAREHGELEGGFKAIADALERAVAAQGLVKFGKPGDEFDPRFHEALMHSHSADVTTTTCQNIISAGYLIGDRVVRPARVTVVDPEPAGTEQPQQPDQPEQQPEQ